MCDTTPPWRPSGVDATPRRTLLSAEARSRLLGVPTERAEMARHYVLDAADLALIRARGRAANRLRLRRLDLEPNPSSAIEAEEVARYDPIAQVRVSQWRIRQADGTGQTMAPLVLRQFFPQELPLLLEAGGLRLMARYGDFARNPLRPESLNQVCLAEAGSLNRHPLRQAIGVSP